ncbi:MAG: (Fe-S)-binding protein, partial [Nitrospirae bacterium]|nr:(Fe-S)-binding protein [Nitrospirota bacterium]
QCTCCNRCGSFCPYGIDTAEITMAAREILNSVGLVQKYMHEIIFKAQTLGNNLGMQQNAIVNALEFVQDDLQEQLERDDIRIPIDEEGADVLFVTPSADFFASPHIESLYGYAKVFNRAALAGPWGPKAPRGATSGRLLPNKDIWKR